LTAIILVKLPDPQFEGQTKNKLGNPEVRGCRRTGDTEYFNHYLEEHPGIARKYLVGSCSLVSPAPVRLPELPVRTALAGVRRRRACLVNWPTVSSYKDPAASEIYSVEGDLVAGGSS